MPSKGGKAVIGLCTIQLSVPESQSLKERRRVVKSLVARIHNAFNVSVADVGSQEVWQSAALGVACVSNDAAQVHSLLLKVVEMIEHSRLDAQVEDYSIEVW